MHGTSTVLVGQFCWAHLREELITVSKSLLCQVRELRGMTGNSFCFSAPLWGPAGPWLKMTNDALLYLQGHAHIHNHTCVHTGQVSVYIHMCTDTDTHMHSVMCTHMHAYASHTHTDTRRWYAENKALKSRELVLNLRPHALGIFLLGDGAT